MLQRGESGGGGFAQCHICLPSLSIVPKNQADVLARWKAAGQDIRFAHYLCGGISWAVAGGLARVVGNSSAENRCVHLGSDDNRPAFCGEIQAHSLDCWAPRRGEGMNCCSMPYVCGGAGFAVFMGQLGGWVLDVRIMRKSQVVVRISHLQKRVVSGLLEGSHFRGGHTADKPDTDHVLVMGLRCGAGPVAQRKDRGLRS